MLEAFNRLFPLRVHLRTLRLISRFVYSTPHVSGGFCIVRSSEGLPENNLLPFVLHDFRVYGLQRQVKLEKRSYTQIHSNL
ncbi:MAG: hypothetical protein C5S48_00175 [Candidatus Methanogaster sp.]|nr:MAG: hypothetical protein C5S48_00175 [ANME-2 cluster archaeon]